MNANGSRSATSNGGRPVSTWKSVPPRAYRSDAGPASPAHCSAGAHSRVPTHAGAADALVQVEPGDGRVPHLHHRLRLLLEPPAAGLGLLDERLDGDEPRRVELPAAEHLPLAAAAEPVEQEEVVEGEVAAEAAHV